MSKFCEFCGNPMEDDATVCPKCNAVPTRSPQTDPDSDSNISTDVPDNSAVNNVLSETSVSSSSENTPNSGTASYEQPAAAMPQSDAPVNDIAKKNKKTATITIGIVCLVFLIVIINVFIAALGGGYKKPLDNFCKAYNKDKAEYFEKVYPELYFDIVDEDNLEDSLDDSLDSLEDKFGKNIKLSYKVKDKEKLDKDDLDDLEDDIDDYFDKSVKITKGYDLEVELTVKGKKKDRDKKIDVTVFKCDGDWVIMSELSPDTITYTFT